MTYSILDRIDHKEVSFKRDGEDFVIIHINDLHDKPGDDVTIPIKELIRVTKLLTEELEEINNGNAEH